MYRICSEVSLEMLHLRCLNLNGSLDFCKYSARKQVLVLAKLLRIFVLLGFELCNFPDVKLCFRTLSAIFPG